MPVIGHSFSPECAGIGVPASTPAAIAASRTKAVSHFLIANEETIYGSNACQGKCPNIQSDDARSRETPITALAPGGPRGGQTVI